jgi:rod shape-determining protein MreD
MAADVVKAAALVFLAAVLQTAILSEISIGRGTPNLLLVTLVAIALLRGAVFGALVGFFAGLLLDTATFETLGLTSLILTVAGYWIGRYGETTGRDRAHAPFVSVAVVSVLYSTGLLVLRYVLGEPAPARVVLVDALLPTILLNLLLTAPVYAVVRRLLRPSAWTDRAQEVRLLG